MSGHSVAPFVSRDRAPRIDTGYARQVSDLDIERRPELHRPILVAAWTGWNDAGESATGAIRFIRRRWREEPFARINPDRYYDFTQARPRVRLDNGQRVIEWPRNDFTAHHREGDAPDLILFRGIEPHLAWRSYVQQISQVIREFDVSAVVTLGGLLAEVSHARPIRLTGASDDPALQAMLDLQPRRGPGYEGPTGIVGILGNALRDAAIPAASIWANVPHYVNASPNPKGTLALLEKLNIGLDLGLRLHDMEVFVARFDAQVAEEVARNPEMVEYARRLEESGDDDDVVSADDSPDETSDDLPDAQSMVDELERFLREQRRDEG